MIIQKTKNAELVKPFQHSIFSFVKIRDPVGCKFSFQKLMDEAKDDLKIIIIFIVGSRSLVKKVQFFKIFINIKIVVTLTFFGRKFFCF